MKLACNMAVMVEFGEVALWLDYCLLIAKLLRTKNPKLNFLQAHLIMVFFKMVLKLALITRNYFQAPKCLTVLVITVLNMNIKTRILLKKMPI